MMRKFPNSLYLGHASYMCSTLYIYIYIYIYMYIYIYIYIYICMYVCLCMYVFVYVCMQGLSQDFKMPVLNSNSKMSAHTDLPTNLLQILIPTTFNSLLCRKRQFTLQLCPKRWFVRMLFGYYPQKSKLKIHYIEILACPKRRFSGN